MRLDLPLPDTPVMAVMTPAGISTSIERRLFALAPIMRIPGRMRPGRGERGAPIPDFPAKFEGGPSKMIDPPRVPIRGPIR